MPSHTHVGHATVAGRVHHGRLHGHGDYRGRSHALNGTPRPYQGATYRALCGVTIRCEDDGYRLSVEAAPDQSGGGVGCKRCLRLLK